MLISKVKQVYSYELQNKFKKRFELPKACIYQTHTFRSLKHEMSAFNGSIKNKSELKRILKMLEL